LAGSFRRVSDISWCLDRPRLEYSAPDLRVPVIAALIIGLLLEIGALASDSLYLSAACGIIGMTALFDAVEFRRQFKRVKKGHAPANPDNPRHARLLADDGADGAATTIDWLKREPAGHVVDRQEALTLLTREQAA
jgi:hypothetical protein